MAGELPRMAEADRGTATARKCGRRATTRQPCTCSQRIGPRGGRGGRGERGRHGPRRRLRQRQRDHSGREDRSQDDRPRSDAGAARGRQGRGQEAGVEIEWVEGDAQELPFEDASFDVVTSVFGCMFAPDQRAAAEIARVLKPGGRMAVCAWTPEGNMGGCSSRSRTPAAAPRGIPAAYPLGQ